MKRALAERAKQSGLPNGMGPPQEVVSPERAESTVAPQPILKMARVSSTSSGKSSSAGASSSPSAALSTLSGSKRQREGAAMNSLSADGADDEDDTSFAAFYLRHQNRALASELSSLKHQLAQMKRERDYRRTQCRKACQSLNSLQATWTQMEAALQFRQPLRGDMRKADDHRDKFEGATKDHGSIQMVDSKVDVPVSSGSGKSAELVGALLDSLADLGNLPVSKTQGTPGFKSDTEDDDSSVESSESLGLEMPMEFKQSTSGIDETERQQLDDLLRITDNVSRRADVLQRWIWSLLDFLDGDGAESKDSNKVTMINKLSRRLARKEAIAKRLKSQLKEVAQARDEMKASDKRVRRGLYRLAAGRVQLKEVLKAIERSDEDKEAAVAWMEVSSNSVGSVVSAAIPNPVAATFATGNVNEAHPVESADIGCSKLNEKSRDISDNPHVVDASQLAKIQRRVSELEQIAASRDEQIQELLREREAQTKRINGLLIKSDICDATREPSDEDVQRSNLYAQVRSKLATSERRLRDQQEILKRARDDWSKALGNVELARTTIEELQAKHAKKWTELAFSFSGAHDEKCDPKNRVLVESKVEFPSLKADAKEIVGLRHKLTQAMENVRQAETTRSTLSEAVLMNEALQAKLEEVKAKYGALQAGRSGGNQSSAANSTTATPKPKPSGAIPFVSSSTPIEKSEKLHRDYRRVRKELAAVTASKEAAKAKLERTEKERDALVQTNVRLLKQTAEKDEMNAKSLSTILHLKQVTEQITKEKSSLEQQAKSAHQLALSARLATNARDRLEEEFIKERQILGKCVEDWEQKFATLSREKEFTNEKMQQQKAKVSTLLKDFAAAKTRCEELASQSTKLREEKKVVVESLAIAQREAVEASKRADSFVKHQTAGSGVQSEFTVGQLTTQVSVLKGRLACPVCNHRDKKCILMRCRHMFCKPCVEENIKNRSRKCPACGGRFDTKDVADVWL